MATLGMPLLGTGQETPTLTSLLTARREREKQSRLADLLANAYGAQDQAQRQGYITDAIRTDPTQGMTLARMLDPRMQDGGTPAGLAEFRALTQGLPEDDVMRARRVRLGLDPRQSSAAIGYQKITGPDGREYLVATDPRGVGATTIGGGPGFGSFGGQQPAPQQMQPPDKAGMEADIALANQLAQAGFDPDKIDAFLANRGRMAEQQPAPQGMNPFASQTPQEKAYATEVGQQRAQMQYLPAQEQIKTQAAIDQARGVAQANADVARDVQAPKRRENFRLVQEGIQNTINSIDGAINRVNWATAGPIGAATRGIWGTPAYVLARAAATVKANIGFDRLQQMRDASPTGGALGQVAVQELEALQASIASLDQGLPPSELEANLKTVRRHYQNWLNAVMQAEQSDFGGQRSASPQQPQQPAGGGFRILPD